MKPGTRVQHAVKNQQYDLWVGVVTEIETHERIDGSWTLVWVRWIKPDGCPSDGSTSHDPAELVGVES